MNAKGGVGQIFATAVVAAIATVGVNKLTDSNGDEKATAASIATLNANMANLTKQVEKLNEQPYATRGDIAGLESRISGLDGRVDSLEQRASTPRR